MPALCCHACHLRGDFISLEADAHRLPVFGMEFDLLPCQRLRLALVLAGVGILGDLDLRAADDDAEGVLSRRVNAQGNPPRRVQLHLILQCAVGNGQRTAQGGSLLLGFWHGIPDRIFTNLPGATSHGPRFGRQRFEILRQHFFTLHWRQSRRGFLGHDGRQLAAVAAIAVAVQQGAQLLHHLGVLRADIRHFGRIFLHVVKLGLELAGARLAGTQLDLAHRHALDPLPRPFADGKDTVRAVDEQVVARGCRALRAEKGGQRIEAVLRSRGGGRQRLAHECRRGGQDVGHADHVIAHCAGGDLGRPAGDEGHLEAALPHVVFAAAQSGVHLQPCFEGLRLHAVARGGEDAAVVAAENDQRVLRQAFFVQRLQHAAHAAVQLLDPVAVGSGLALAGHVLVRRHRAVHRHGRVVEEERRARFLLRDPFRSLAGQQRHHALIHTPGRVEREDGRLAALRVLGAIGGLEVRIVGIRAFQLHARRDFPAAQAIDKTVLHKHTREVAMIARHAKVVVKADVQRPGGKLGGVVRAPL